MSGTRAPQPVRWRRWRAEASPEAVAEMRSILRDGDILVPVRVADHGAPEVDAGLVDRAGAASVEQLPPLPAGSVVVRTSGSTGRPRQIVIGRDAFEASARAAAARLDLRPEDVWWASLSPAHVGGLALLLRAEVLGCGLELTGGFDPAVFWELCAAGRITHASLVPTMLRRILEARPADADPGALRAVLVGGAAADPELLGRAIDAGIPVATTWGMTETASQVATATPLETAADPTRACRPLTRVKVRADEAGRLAVRTPTMAIGELVEGRVRPLADDEGWFQTDDLGRVDAEGFVRITGRVSDRIISGGVNVDPIEVERVLRELPWVRDVAVVGVPDEEWGERVVAAVVLDEGAPADEEARLAALPADLRGARRPRALMVVEALPLNANGKLDRAAVRAACTESGRDRSARERS